MTIEALTSASNPRRRFHWRQYSIRALLTLVLVASVPAWWLRIELDRLASEHDAIEKLRSAGAHVTTAPAEPQWFWRHLPKTVAPYPERAERLEAANYNCTVGSGEMPLVARLTHLKSLFLGRLPIEDDDLAACTTLTELEYLNFTNCRRLASKAIGHFRNARRLRHLDFGATPIDDAALETIVTFEQLEDLRLSYTHVSDASMPQIVRLKGLKMLNLPRGVTSRGLRQIERLTSLTHLSVYLRAGEDVEDLRHICRLQRLRSLHIRGHVSDAGLEMIANVNSLERLSIFGNGFSDGALADLKRSPRSRPLDVTTFTSWNKDEDDRIYAHGLPTRAEQTIAVPSPGRRPRRGSSTPNKEPTGHAKTLFMEQSDDAENEKNQSTGTISIPSRACGPGPRAPLDAQRGR
ncbi:MAG: leucine-rich repeat domain-containing protein [Pirellulales bacterium]